MPSGFGHRRKTPRSADGKHKRVRVEGGEGGYERGISSLQPAQSLPHQAAQEEGLRRREEGGEIRGTYHVRQDLIRCGFIIQPKHETGETQGGKGRKAKYPLLARPYPVEGGPYHPIFISEEKKKKPFLLQRVKGRPSTLSKERKKTTTENIVE